MAESEAGHVDLEALQAQIDLSMSVTEELVASWIKPVLKAGTRKPAQSTLDAEKELQEYMRRPPRLGVGAPLPESSGVSAREEMKLKNKLSVDNRKRRRDASSIEKVGDAGPDDEEAEGRKGESSTKRVRLDPFSLKSKRPNKGGNRVTGADDASRASGTPKTSSENDNEKIGNPDPSATSVGQIPTPTKDIPQIPDQKALQEDSKVADAPGSEPTKKKKKKRKKTKVDPVGNPSVNGATDDVSVGANKPPEEPADGEDEDAEEWTGFDESTLKSILPEYNQEAQQSTLPSSPVAQVPTTPTKSKSPSTALQISPPRAIPLLLNLDGPPPSGSEDDRNATASVTGQSPSSRKRRRRKNKKKAQAGVEGR